ncbi:hypothetical protein TcCL_NonESM04134 [Trypanosoma cruzi]|nr:hypothetical protein TcCL_NonESM04134 [Trypanosoma cruzi]
MNPHCGNKSPQISWYYNCVPQQYAAGFGRWSLPPAPCQQSHVGNVAGAWLLLLQIIRGQLNLSNYAEAAGGIVNSKSSCDDKRQGVDTMKATTSRGVEMSGCGFPVRQAWQLTSKRVMPSSACIFRRGARVRQFASAKMPIALWGA